MPNPGRIDVVEADITRLHVDAIVNAANARLLGGGGVDGTIHRAAGHRLLEACRAIPEASPGVRCPVGEARITPGFDLPARFVIHTVGPVWEGGSSGEAQLLANCHLNSLALAVKHDVRTIAFPAISTGVYGYPMDLAADVATRAVRDALARLSAIERVTFACFDDAAADTFRQALRALG